MSAGFQEQEHYSFYPESCGRNDCGFTGKLLPHYHCKQCNYKAAKRPSIDKHVKTHFPGESFQDVKETELSPESLPSEVLEKEADKRRRKSKKRNKKKKAVAKENLQSSAQSKQACVVSVPCGTEANESRQQEAAAGSQSVDTADDKANSDSVRPENRKVDEWEEATDAEYQENLQSSAQSKQACVVSVPCGTEANESRQQEAAVESQSVDTADDKANSDSVRPENRKVDEWEEATDAEYQENLQSSAQSKQACVVSVPCGTEANESRQQEAAAGSQSVDTADDKANSDSVRPENRKVDEWEEATDAEYQENLQSSAQSKQACVVSVPCGTEANESRQQEAAAGSQSVDTADDKANSDSVRPENRKVDEWEEATDAEYQENLQSSAQSKQACVVSVPCGTEANESRQQEAAVESQSVDTADDKANSDSVRPENRKVDEWEEATDAEYQGNLQSSAQSQQACVVSVPCGAEANESDQQEATVESQSVDIADDETKSDSVLPENWKVDEWEEAEYEVSEEEWSFFSYMDSIEAGENVSTVDDQDFDDSQYSDTFSSWDLESIEKPEKNILLINILDSLLLDIFKKAGGAEMDVNDMEEAVKARTGRMFSFWHQFVIDCHPHGLEPFIDNDSFLFAIDELGFVLATIDLSMLASKMEIRELDLSRQDFASTAHFIENCVIVNKHMFRKLILREVHLKELQNTLRSPLPLPVVEVIQWFCPNLTQVDITGCSEELRDIFLNQSSNVDIVDYLDPGQILDHSDIGTKILELLEQNALSPAAECQGWTLLHTAALLGDSQLCQYLLKSGSCGNSKYLGGEITAMEIAFALHNIEVVELMFQYLQHDNTDAAQFVALGLLSDHISESNILTSFLADDQLKKLENMHNVHCNTLKLFENLCNNRDIDFKRRLFEEILLKMHRTASSDCKTMFSCWTETTIFETVRFLCQEINWTPEATVMGVAPYLMYVTSSPSLVRYFLENGATVNSKDSGGNTPLFYVVCRATEGSVSQSKEVCSLLLEWEIDPNIYNYLHETALMYNLSYSSKPCNLCPPKAALKCQVSFLESNAHRCSPDIWEILLNNGAKSKCKTVDNKSLFYSLLKAAVHDIKSNNDEYIIKSMDVISKLVSLLRQYGATLGMRDDEGNCVVHEWAQSDLGVSYQQYTKVLANIFLDPKIVNAQNDKGDGPLHLANNWLKITLLIEKGANPNAQDQHGNTPLSNLVSSQDSIDNDVWTDALKLGMDPWLESVNGDSIFRQLVKSNRLSEAQTLVEACVNVSEPERNVDVLDKRDSQGNTLLHIFCMSDHIIKYLLENGAKVNAQNKNGETPLHLVCLQVIKTQKDVSGDGSVLCTTVDNILLLRKYHAKIDITNMAGLTCEKILEFSDFKEVLTKPVQTEDKFQLKWKKESLTHRRKLLEIACGHAFTTVEAYCYHPQHIGKGSFGLVFAGIDTTDKKEIALKRMEKQRMGERELTINREIDCLLRLKDCEKVLRYYGCASNETSVYIALELMDGTLTELLEKLGTNHKLDLSICVDIAAGMQYIHGQEILHRDLKSTNVLYRQHGPDMSSVIIKISDFGLGKILDSSDSDSVMHSKAGARKWMAPELKLVKGIPEHTKASDVYSCGLVMRCVLNREPSECLQEARHLLYFMLCKKPEIRPTASEILLFPFFWDDNKKRNFINNVSEEIHVHGNTQPFIATLKNAVLSKHILKKGNGWNERVPIIFHEMVSSGLGYYNTASIVCLIRFIRNTFVHPENLSQDSRKAVFEDFIFFKKFPTLVITVYEAVKQHGWGKRPKIRDVLNA